MFLIILITAAIFFILMPIDLILDFNRPRKHYLKRDTVHNIEVVLIYILTTGFYKVYHFAIFAFFYQFRIFTIPNNIFTLVILFFLVDLMEYWNHRAHHRVNIFWAAHILHHSSESFNLSTAGRIPATHNLYKWIFWAPLSLLGFDPVSNILMQGVMLLYGMFIHTEHPYLINLIRFFHLEWLLVTNVDHAVHHGRNEQYVDKNYSNTFIIWDKLFGTYEKCVEKVDYGINDKVNYSLIHLYFDYYAKIFMAVFKSKSWYEVFGYLFRHPGWVAPKS